MDSSPLDELWPHFRMKLGDHCLRNGHHKLAKQNYEQSLSLDPEKLDSVYRLAKELAYEGKLDQALQKLSLVSGKKHFKCILQECDCLYENNDFEKNILKLNENKIMVQDYKIEIPHSNKRTKIQQDDAFQKGPKLSELNRRFHMVTTNYVDIIGNKAGFCVYNLRKYFDKVQEIWQQSRRKTDETPIVMKNTHVCTIFENKKLREEKKPPREERHSEVLHRMFAQSYMLSAWKDFDFIKQLKSNRTLKRSTQNEHIQKNIARAVEECTKGTSVIIKQLHARCPLYSKKHQATLNPARAKYMHKIRICQLRNEIDFALFSSLTILAKCLKEGKLKKLLKNAEYELSTRLRMYPTHITPRRDDFVSDICNYVALGYINDLIAKLSLLLVDKTPDDNDLLAKIFGIDFSNNAIVEYRFGDQSTFREPGKPDISSSNNKDNAVFYDRRMKLKPMLKIELCYLTHELAWENLRKRRMEDARVNGWKIVEIAQDVSYHWQFLGLIMVCRADVLQLNFENVKKTLEKAQNIVHIFKSEKLEKVLDVAMRSEWIDNILRPSN